MEGFLIAVFEFIRGIFRADTELSNESLYGDSSEQRASRNSCQWGCFALLLVAIVIGVVLSKR